MARGRVGRHWASRALVVAVVLGVAMLPSAALAEDPGETRSAAREARQAEREAKRDAQREAKEAERAEKEAEREKERAERQEARRKLDDARADLRRAEAAHAAARRGVLAARGAGGAAEGSRRVAEEALAPTIIDHQQAQDEFRDARLRVRVLREDLADTEEELELARVQFDERVVRAYKQGSVAAGTTLALSIFQEASSPGELASALKDLEVIAGFGAIRLVDLEEEIVHLQAALVTAIAERADAKQEVERTEGLIEGKEAEATTRRAGAVVAEANLLAATRRELESERAVERAKPLVEVARAEYERVRDGEEPRGRDDESTSASVDLDEDEEDEPRTAGEWIANRERALAHQRSLPEAHRRAADDWVCPVEDSRFVNDWAFPRSQERRHEGTDVFAPEGTPIVAAVDAEVVAVNHVDRFNGRSGFGGLTASYEADTDRYYNAHLQRIRPGLEVGDELEAGDIIGWVGRTGNARGTPPHLHLGVYVDDVAVNPYPSLAVACAADGRATGDDADAELVAELDQRRADREERREERRQRREEREDADGPAPATDGPQ